MLQLCFNGFKTWCQKQCLTRRGFGKQAKSSAARLWENDIYENGNYFGDFGDDHDDINADDYQPVP